MSVCCFYGARRWLVSQWHVPCVKEVSAIRTMCQFVFFLNIFLLSERETFLLFIRFFFFSFVPGLTPNPPTTGAGSSPSAAPVSPPRPIFVCYFKQEIKKEAKHDPAALHEGWGGGGGGKLRFRSAKSALSWSKCTLVTSDSVRYRSCYNQHLD